MSSLHALKYKVHVKSSRYAGYVVFLLYLFIMILSLSVVSLSPISSLFYLTLFFIAAYASKESCAEQGELLFSESGLVERMVKEKSFNGQIGRYSFYNGFFIFLQLEVTNTVFTQKSTKQFITIYKDAITDEQYRLLARLINSGRG